jgi:hypothetical protein
MNTQLKISIGCDSLCQLNKYTTCLEKNEKMKENVESRYKTKLCFIWQRLTSGKTNELGKKKSRHQKTKKD